MPTSNAKPPRNRKLRNGLIVGSVIYVLGVPLAFFWGAMSVMASDAGVTPAIETYIYVNMALPVVMVLAPIAAWIAWAFRADRIALILILLPIAWAVLAFALIFTLG